MNFLKRGFPFFGDVLKKMGLGCLGDIKRIGLKKNNLLHLSLAFPSSSTYCPYVATLSVLNIPCPSKDSNPRTIRDYFSYVLTAKPSNQQLKSTRYFSTNEFKLLPSLHDKHHFAHA